MNHLLQTDTLGPSGAINLNQLARTDGSTSAVPQAGAARYAARVAERSLRRRTPLPWRALGLARFRPLNAGGDGAARRPYLQAVCP
jgi:hypothetical protein